MGKITIHELTQIVKKIFIETICICKILETVNLKGPYVEIILTKGWKPG